MSQFCFGEGNIFLYIHMKVDGFYCCPEEKKIQCSPEYSTKNLQNLGFIGEKKPHELDLCGDRILKVLKNKDGKALRGFPVHIEEHPGVQRSCKEQEINFDQNFEPLLTTKLKLFHSSPDLADYSWRIFFFLN